MESVASLRKVGHVELFQFLLFYKCIFLVDATQKTLQLRKSMSVLVSSFSIKRFLRNQGEKAGWLMNRLRKDVE